MGPLNRAADYLRTIGEGIKAGFGVRKSTVNRINSSLIVRNTKTAEKASSAMATAQEAQTKAAGQKSKGLKDRLTPNLSKIRAVTNKVHQGGVHLFATIHAGIEKLRSSFGRKTAEAGEAKIERKLSDEIVAKAKENPKEAAELFYAHGSDFTDRELNALVKVISEQCKNPEEFASVVKHFMLKELEQANDAPTLFRGNTMANKLQSAFGQKYLASIFSDAIEQARSRLSPTSYTDESRTITDEGQVHVREIVMQMMSDCNEVLSAHNDDPGLRAFTAMCSEVAEAAEKKFPGASNTVGANAFFLRFLNPSLVDPSKIEDPIRRQNVVLVGKVLQNLANKAPFKEEKMAVFNTLITDANTGRESIMRQVLTSPKQKQTDWGLESVRENRSLFAEYIRWGKSTHGQEETAHFLERCQQAIDHADDSAILDEIINMHLQPQTGLGFGEEDKDTQPINVDDDMRMRFVQQLQELKTETDPERKKAALKGIMNEFAAQQNIWNDIMNKFKKDAH